MEVARNPSDENIKYWLAYLNKKNALAERLRVRIAQFSTEAGVPAAPSDVIERVAASANSKAEVDPSRFRIRTYFETTCPHCRRMLGTLKELQLRGIFVEALQIDRGNVAPGMFPIATGVADPADVKHQGIESVPFTLIADLKTKTVLKPVTGFKTSSEIVDLLRLMSRQRN